MRIFRLIPTRSVIMDRHPLNEDTMSLAEYLKAGGAVPPIHVAKTEHGAYRICDGRHRVTAHKLLGRPWIMATYAY